MHGRASCSCKSLCPLPFCLAPFAGANLSCIHNLVQAALSACLLGGAPVEHLAIQRPIGIGLHLAAPLHISPGLALRPEPGCINKPSAAACTIQMAACGALAQTTRRMTSNIAQHVQQSHACNSRNCMCIASACFFLTRRSRPARVGTHLSPECAVPFPAALLRPPTLLRPAMLRALPAPVRAVRAVLAFVATLSARATCSDHEQLSGLTKSHAICPYSYSFSPGMKK